MPASRRMLIVGLAATATAGIGCASPPKAKAEILGRLPPADARIAERLIVIGDSYSQTTSTNHTYPKWSKQLVAAGYAGSLLDLARGGMTASDVGRPGRSEDCFRLAVDEFAERNVELGEDDVVVVYLGHLDLLAYRTPEYATLARSMADYERELDRLMALWPAGTRRRVVLVKPHDRGWNRSDRRIVRARTVEWNAWLDGVAAARPDVATADVFAVVDRLLADPAAFGIEELREPDRQRSYTTSLMFDGSHFGGRGQEIIATAVLEAMQRT